MPTNGSSYANGINGNGQIVGGTGAGNAFLWTSTGGMQAIGALPGGDGSGYAWSINDSGTVVGYSSATGGSV